MDESTCLESMRLGNGTVGSNPTLSAIRNVPCKIGTMCVLNAIAAEAVGFERRGSRGDTPAWGDTRGRPLSGSAQARLRMPTLSAMLKV